MIKRELPPLYDPALEHDNCGVGFISTLNREPEHKVLEMAITALFNLTHRGAVGGDANTGDGAGILFEIPHLFFKDRVKELSKYHIGEYGVGMVFFPTDSVLQKKCIDIIEDSIQSEGLKLISWRTVPTDDSSLGYLAKESQPAIKQCFIEKDKNHLSEQRLYILRKVIENRITKELGETGRDFYICSLSDSKIIYKGMLLAEQINKYFPDLENPLMRTRYAILHQRYSTNTMPEWKLAHPFRYLAHNGEINTLRGNVNKMIAREENLASSVFGDEISKLYPVITPNASDSASFDNCLELLILSGRSPEHSMMMMVPEAFGSKIQMSEDRRAFYEYYSSIIEPWDGPAALIVTDGKSICATLDRNGLRPSRFVITKDGYIIAGSEIGIVEFADDNVRQLGRLQPGKMLSVDIINGRVRFDNEVKSKIVRSQPYRRWLEKNRIELRGLFESPDARKRDSIELLRAQQVFGYATEDIRLQIQDMAENAQEPVGSMGYDSPIAVLSDKPQLFFNYFKQLFAQVTNPPIDAYRESLVMSLMTWLGKKRNILDETEDHCKQLKLQHPIMTPDDLQRVTTTSRMELKSVTIDICYTPAEGGKSLENAINAICKKALEEAEKDTTIIVLSDAGFGPDKVPVPSLLALSAVHQYLVSNKKRESVGLIVNSGEVRDTMHFALLIGYGANAVCPYIAFETISSLKDENELSKELTAEDGYNNFINGIKKGLLKTFSRMGISTLRSYQGAQIFEAIGVSETIINKHFKGTASRIGGIDYDIIAKESMMRHALAYPAKKVTPEDLVYGGVFHYRKNGEKHLWNPTTVSLLQEATSTNNYAKFKQYSSFVDNQQQSLYTIRGLLKFKNTTAISIDEVEPAESIFKRFATGAMSYGSISKEAHEALAIAMNKLGGSSNTGEGGEEIERFTTRANGDNACSAIKQIASGRFGVTTNYLVNAKELQIKIAQGAKPGEGGQLPGHKVDEVIGRTRHSTPGVTLISPPPHHDIYSIEDMAQLIFDLHCVNTTARVSVKLVSEVGVATVAAGVAKGKADMVLIAGYDGGTGASPLTSIQHAGIPWELGLAETQQVLVSNHLRDKIRVQVDGKLMTGRDVVIGALLGAEEFGFATSALIILGCCMLRKCHLNTCTMGVATQDTDLRALYRGKAEYVVNFFQFLAQEIREIMASLGMRTMDEMVGRSDLLEVNKAINHWKANSLDLSKMLYYNANPPVSPRCTKPQDHMLHTSLDRIKLIELAKPALERKQSVMANVDIKNIHRSVGTMLSGELVKKYGEGGLPSGTIHFKFKGNAGQCFGGFLAKGITMELEGYANDYLGKGMSGGRIVVYPPKTTTIDPADNIVVGNTLLYGATSGEIFIRGAAGERFAVRNSGATAVIEGLGDHGCEYMTGGKVVVLGITGKNFAAGMSGGIAYVWDPNQTFDNNCNLEMVDLTPVIENNDRDELKLLLTKHHSLTGSEKAKNILDKWEESIDKFVKVFPIDYKQALKQMKEREMASSDNINITEEVIHG
ncbi:MAG: glutamate synthase subunit alpha [Spirochaetes bacterium GWF1_31_7]|nr:MAG: glutamate synthase subunit alpha [Spirochaetes bacterium GWE1_32_154]OHD47288.1 MAG: glutamate synthase subunit alpha [Spirochaetes bacterium GWF1_31_7]OHD49466.1 MAG: glutamate synthase subunit alpha [Spirochaetes bacterium GWE2_31_10]HBI38896.1 glutamate synthase large subunit [Spirochaetia bacterium]